MTSILPGRVARTLAAPKPPHTLSTSCWCQPRTAFDGHLGDDPVFEAMAGDPIDPAGFPLEVPQ
jgi:hypothetical protein